jgi:hypothetical protein
LVSLGADEGDAASATTIMLRRRLNVGIEALALCCCGAADANAVVGRLRGAATGQKDAYMMF